MDSDSEVVSSAWRALKDIRYHRKELPEVRAIAPRLAAAMPKRGVDTRKVLVKVLGEIGNQKTVAALIAMAKGDAEESLRCDAIKSLGKIGHSDAFDTVVACLRSPSSSLRLAAINALGSLKDPRQVELLLKILKTKPPDRSRDHRDRVLRSLAKAGGRKALDAILETARSKSPIARQALFILGFFKRDIPVAVAMLDVVLTEPDEKVNRAVCNRLWSWRHRLSERTMYKEFARKHLGRVMEARNSPHAAVRCSVARLAPHVSRKRSVELLLSMVKDPDALVRYEVVRAFPRDKRVFKAVLTLMVDPDARVRIAAAGRKRVWRIKAAPKLNAAKAEHLIRELSNRDSTARMAAAKLLGQCKAVTAVGPLLQLLARERGVNIGKLINVLSQIGDRRAIGPLSRMLVERKHYASALNEALNRLDRNWWKTPEGRKAVTAMIENFEKAAAPGKATLADDLGYCRDPRVVPPLVEALKSDDWTRHKAAIALSRHGDRRAVEPLLARLKIETSLSTIIKITTALGALKETKAALARLKRLLYDTKIGSRMIRYRAVSAVGSLGDPEGIELLLRTVVDVKWLDLPGHHPHAVDVNKALRRIDPKWATRPQAIAAIPAIAAAMDGEDRRARHSACWLLGYHIHHPQAAEPLLKALDNSELRDNYVDAVINGLLKIGGPKVIAGLKARKDHVNPKRRKIIRKAIARLTPKPKPASRPASQPASQPRTPGPAPGVFTGG